MHNVMLIVDRSYGSETDAMSKARYGLAPDIYNAHSYLFSAEKSASEELINDIIAFRKDTDAVLKHDSPVQTRHKMMYASIANFLDLTRSQEQDPSKSQGYKTLRLMIVSDLIFSTSDTALDFVKENQWCVTTIASTSVANLRRRLR